MRKNILFMGAFIMISLITANAQKLYVKGDIIVSNHGILFSGNSTEIDMGSSAENTVTNNHDAYWEDNLTFEIKSGAYDNFGNHRIKENYVQTGGIYTVKHDMNNDDEGADDEWGEMIINGTSTGNIRAEKVFYRNPNFTQTSTIVFYGVPVREKTLSDILSTGRGVANGTNFEWLPNRVDYMALGANDVLRAGVSALITIGNSNTDIMDFKQLHTVEGTPHSGTITVNIWSTNHLNNSSDLNYPRRDLYMGSSESDNNAWDGWNIISNPYPATIDLSRLFESDNGTPPLLNQNAFVYRLSFRVASASQTSNPTTEGGGIWNQETMQGPRYIRPFETFAVQRRLEDIDDEGSGSSEGQEFNLNENILVFTNDNNSTNEDSDIENPDNGPSIISESFAEQLRLFYQNQEEEQGEDGPPLDGIRVQLVQNNRTLAHTYVIYKKGNSKGFDYRDGRQLIRKENTHVYSNSSIDFSAAKLPYFYNITDQEKGQIIPLVIQKTQRKDLHLQKKSQIISPLVIQQKNSQKKGLNLLVQYYSTETNRPVFLEDRLKKTVTKIEPDQVIKIALSDTEYDANRFFLHYAKAPKIEKPAPVASEEDFLVRRHSKIKNKVYTYVNTDARRLAYDVYIMNGKRIKRYRQRAIKKLITKKINGKKYKQFIVTFSNRYNNVPLIVKAYNSNISYDKIVLAN